MQLKFRTIFTAFLLKKHLGKCSEGLHIFQVKINQDSPYNLQHVKRNACEENRMLRKWIVFIGLNDNKCPTKSPITRYFDGYAY